MKTAPGHPTRKNRSAETRGFTQSTGCGRRNRTCRTYRTCPTKTHGLEPTQSCAPVQPVRTVRSVRLHSPQYRLRAMGFADLSAPSAFPAPTCISGSPQTCMVTAHVCHSSLISFARRRCAKTSLISPAASRQDFSRPACRAWEGRAGGRRSSTRQAATRPRRCPGGSC